MKPMSETLVELAAQVKALEDSAATAREQDRTALEQRRREIEGAIDSEVKEFAAAATNAKTTLRRWWLDTRDSIERQIAAMRSDYEQWQAERDLESALRTSELAQDDAAAAIALATYCVNAAEFAVVDAALARAEAEELAAEK